MATTQLGIDPNDYLYRRTTAVRRAYLNDWDWADGHDIGETNDAQVPFPAAIYQCDNGRFIMVIFSDVEWEVDEDSDHAYLPEVMHLATTAESGDANECICRSNEDDSEANWYYDAIIDLRYTEGAGTYKPSTQYSMIDPYGIHPARLF